MSEVHVHENHERRSVVGLEFYDHPKDKVIPKRLKESQLVSRVI